MDVIDVTKGRFCEVEIKGHYGIFTELRVNKSTIPKGLNCYELRHGDDDSYPAALEQGVKINYFGAVLMTDKMETGQDGYVPLEFEDFSFTGETLSVKEYQMNYGETEPELLYAVGLSAFSQKEVQSPELSEQEADVLIGYMEGHEYLLGEHEGTLYRGDLCYAQGIIRWKEYSIDDAVETACEWNGELLERAETEVENAENYAEYVKKKEYLESLKTDEKLLDALFDRTRFGKELDVIAGKIAADIISGLEEKGDIEDAVGKLLAAAGESREAHQEAEERTERAR